MMEYQVWIGPDIILGCCMSAATILPRSLNSNWREIMDMARLEEMTEHRPVIYDEAVEEAKQRKSRDMDMY